MDEQGLKQAVLLGHSFGGRISIQLAAAFPERVLAMVLINGHGLRLPPPLSASLKTKGMGFLRSLIKFFDSVSGSTLFKDWFVPRFASPDYLKAGVLRKTFVKVVNEDLTSEAAGIKVPSFLLWGGADTETPLALGQRLHDLIKNSELVVLPEAGHNMHLDSGAYLCAFHLLPFLQRFLVNRDGGQA